MTELRKIIIDDREIEVDPALTLIQACDQAGIEIPRFCYHERLSIAGNCRMCLVEIVGGPPKPAASCHMQVRDLRPGRDGEPPQVKTNSPMVKKAREGVMEFLLINHPLDCPICDQGGECDLQDQAMAYGVDFSRYREPKRAAVDLQLGPLVETHMTRCISCTRCVRFITEVAGVAELGQIGRGEDSEITNYLGRILDSEMQGNIVDLCPVGALTSKPYAFSARPWELKKILSIDVMDALGSNVRLDVRGREVMRILPRNHDGVNEEWLADRSRHAWDGLRRKRLDHGRIRKAWLAGGEVGIVGDAVDLTYTATRLGAGPETLTGESRGRIEERLRARRAPIVIVGMDALTRPDGAAILGNVMDLAGAAGAKLMVLHRAASRVGGMDVGFAHPDGLGCLDGARLIFNLGADEIDIAPGPCVVYQGSHGDRGAHRADVILPGAAWTEQSGTYVNTEGRPQMAHRAGFPPGDAREDWAILRALSGELDRTLPFETLGQLREGLHEAHPHLAALDRIPANDWLPVQRSEMNDAPISIPPGRHYLVNPILRASRIMGDLERLAAERRAAALAAE